MSKPRRVYTLGSVKVAEFANAGKDGKTFLSYSFQKSYKAQDGKWASSQSFSGYDLAELSVLAGKMAQEFIREYEPKEQFPGQNAPGQTLDGGEWNPDEYQDKF